MSRRKHSRGFGILLRALSALALVTLAPTAAPIDQVRLSLGDIRSETWRLGGVELRIDWSNASAPRLQFDVNYAEAGAYLFKRVKLVCSEFELLADEVNCPRGRLSFAGKPFSAEGVPTSLHYRVSSGQLDVRVSNFALADGIAELEFHQAQDGWKLDIRLTDMALQGLARLVADFRPEVTALSYQGTLGGELEVSGGNRGLRRLTWNLSTESAGYANRSGDQAAEALVLSSQGSATPHGEADWLVKTTLRADKGMVFSDPLYLEFDPQRSLSLTTDFTWRARLNELRIGHLGFKQPQVVDGYLNARLQLAGEAWLQELDVHIEQAQLPGLYSNWLQPWLVGGVLGDLDTRGILRGRLRFAEGAAESLVLDFEDVSLLERGGQFGIERLQGPLRWQHSGAPQSADLSWHALNLYRLQFGAADVALEIGARQVKLRQPLAIPLFDGELRVDEFSLAGEQGRLNWLLDGMLSPVSMQTLSQALGWPPFSGKLSGMFPKVRYHNGELTLGGVLLVQAFDGDITLRNLRIQEPLGLVPRLWLDARLEHLDLKPLTEAFSFGRIEGRLQGQVDGLYMEAWQPVAFDALFRTPPGDRSRHRISQRAVDTISDLGGGGMAGALSRSFLRFLEDFPYQKLGIRCRLENEVCHMGGVGEAANGYYLVKGTLLPPRLDVVGYASEVDWTSLIERLKAATQGAGPSLE